MKPPFYAKAYNQYGAQMGRRNLNANNYGGEKLHLRRVPIDSGGYDPGGAYWGIGSPLWCAYCYIDEGRDTLELYTRAESREAAKAAFADTLGNVPPLWFR